jgi:hypothetical protein
MIQFRGKCPYCDMDLIMGEKNLTMLVPSFISMIQECEFCGKHFEIKISIAANQNEFANKAQVQIKQLKASDAALRHKRKRKTN